MSTLLEKYQLSIKNGQNFVLTLEDLNAGVINEKEITSIHDLVMVHKTNFFPDGAIRTPLETRKSILGEVCFNLNGKLQEYPIVFKSFRDTIHFCLNGSVSSHAYGNWDETKYAILMPLSQNKDKIVAGTECDLFSKGSVPLNETAYILCPKDEVSEMKKHNPNVHVIGYEGNCVSPYIDVFLSQVLGYKYKKPTENSRCWDSGFGNDAELAVKIIEENGWEYEIHNGSEWSREEDRLCKIDLLIQIIKIIQREGFLKSEENLRGIYEVIYGRLDTHNLFSGYSFISDLENDKYFEDICQRLEQATGINMRNFVDGSKKSDRSDYYFGELEKELADTIIKQLRMTCLLEKEQQGLLTEKEIVQLNFEREFGDWQTAISSGLISQDFLSGINEYQELSNKKLNDLTKEQLQTILNVINARLGLLSKKARDSGQIFKLEILEVTPEQADLYRLTGNYKKVRNAGIYLTFSSPQLNMQLSKLSGVNLSEIDDKINSAGNDEIRYELEKQAALLPHCHVDEYLGYFNKIVTDCQLSDVLTVKNLNDRVINYIKLFLEFYNGQKVEFDKKGNLIRDMAVLPELPKTSEDFISDIGGRK